VTSLRHDGRVGAQSATQFEATDFAAPVRVDHVEQLSGGGGDLGGLCAFCFNGTYGRCVGTVAVAGGGEGRVRRSGPPGTWLCTAMVA